MLRTQIFTAIRWTASARMLSQLVTWAITLVVIRLLTPADYGLLAMATIFLGFLLMVADVGIAPVLVQKEELSERELRQAFGIVLVLHLVLAIALAAAAPLLARFFNELRLVDIVRVLSLQLVISAFAVIPDATLQRKLEFRKRAVLDLCAVITGSLLTLALALAGSGVWALVFGSITSHALKATGVNLISRSMRWPEFSLAGTQSLLSSGGQATLARILWYVLMQADAFIAGKWLGKEALGVYSVSMHLASLPNQRISALISEVAFPAFSRMQHDRSWVAANTLRGVRMLSIISFPLLWGISSVAPEIVTVFLGLRWTEAILPLQILSLVMPLRMISIFVSNPIAGVGRFDVGLANISITLAVMVSAFLAGVHWGLIGLCLAWLIATPLVFAATMRRNLAVLAVPVKSFLVSMGRPAGAASMMFVVVTVCRMTIPANVTRPVQLALLILAGALTYVLMTLLVNRRASSEALALVRGVAGRRER